METTGLMRAAQTGVVNPRGMRAYNETLSAQSHLTRAAAASTGQLLTSQVKLASGTENYTESLKRHKASLMDVIRARSKMSQLSRRTFEEQMAMQSTMIREVGRTSSGKGIYDVFWNPAVAKNLDTGRMKMQFFREEMKSVATQTVNWGKNMQWAGRQIMVGFTVPLLAAAAATGVFAKQVDEQLTRIQKVYNTTANQASTSTAVQMEVSRELGQVRVDSLKMAQGAAKTYGASVTDVLEVEADLAAQGNKGNKLLQNTTEVIKNATLGEIEYQDALSATVAMQRIFHLSQTETSNAWAYMNSVENSTVLQMKDFAKAIPIAAAPIREFGGDIKTLGTLLVAMRERGIQVGQGANAIKAAMQRLSRPSTQIREEFEAITNIPLQDVMDRHENDIIGFFRELGELTDNLSGGQRRTIFAGLFGGWQVTRMTAMVDGVMDLKEGIGQTSIAARVAGQSVAQWRKTQEQELKKIQESLSGRFKRAWEGLKADLVGVGTEFLKLGIVGIDILNKIVDAFKGAPGIVKWFGKWAAISAAIIGPVTMLAGLFGNLLGTVAKGVLTLSNLGGGFRLLTTEERAAQLVTQNVEKTFKTVATSAEMAAANFRLMGDAIRAAAAEMGLFNQVNMGGAPLARGQGVPYYTPATSGGYAKVTPKFNTPGQQAQQWATGIGAMPYNISGAKDVEESTKKTAGYGAKFAASMGVASAAMAASYVSSNKTVDQISNIAMLTAIIGPGVAMIASGIGRWATTLGRDVAGKIKNINIGSTAIGQKWTAANGTLGKTKVLVRAIGASLWAAVGWTGAILAAIGAIVAALYVMNKRQNDAAESWKKMHDNGKALADIIGYTYRQPFQLEFDKGDKAVNTVTKIANTFPKIVKDIQQTNDESQKFSKAWEVGLQVINTGGTMSQAKQAVKLALRAADGEAKANAIMIRFKSDMNSLKEATSFGMQVAQQEMNIAMDRMDDMGFSEKFFNFFEVGQEASDKISNETTAILEGVAAKAAAFARSQGDMPYFDWFSKQIEVMNKRIEDSRGTEQYTYNKALKEQFVRTQAHALGVENLVKGMSQEWFAHADAVELATKMNIINEKKERYEALKTLVETGKANAVQIVMMRALGVELANDRKKFRQMTEETSDTGDKTGIVYDNIIGVKHATDGANAAAKGLSGTWSSLKDATSTIVDAMKGAMTTTQDQIGSIATDNFDNRMDAAMEALDREAERRTSRMQANQEREQHRLEAQQERAQRVLDDTQEKQARRLDAQWEKRNRVAESRWDQRQKNIEGAYDQRIEHVNKLIKAEEDAEEKRKKIFDAEMTRLQRMADMANQNIDFNLALNKGDLEEAAKLQNQIISQSTEWALSDAQDEGEGKSANKVDALQARIDNIEKLKETRLDAFQDERDAFFRHLKRIEDREKRSLQDRQDTARRMLQNRQEKETAMLQKQQERNNKMLQKEIDNNKDAQQEIWENRRDKLNRAIEDFKAYIPKNEADLKRHIRIISKRYGDFRVDMKGKFNRTSVDVQQMLYRQIRLAHKEMVSDIAWDIGGAKIADQMLKGAFGLNRKGFYKWMTTGMFPGKKKPPSIKQMRADRRDRRSVMNNLAQRQQHNDTRLFDRHEGGPIGGAGKDSRKGVARTTPGLHSSEALVRAQKGEYMMQRKAVDKYGPDFMDRINRGLLDARGGATKDKGAARRTERSGKIDRTAKGGGTGLGFAGLMYSMLGAAMKSSIDTAAYTGATNMLQQAAAATGSYSVTGSAAGMGKDQMKNAATIASVGKQLGASKRDILIALMTALVESRLTNYAGGMGSSVGLFQQIDAWGTFAQRHDPREAARMFFQGGHQGQMGLFDYKNRDKLPMGVAAQSVQRSAYPDRYATMEDEARAIMAALTYSGGNLQMGPGGKHRPVRGGTLVQGIHDSYTGFPSVDIAKPVGSRLFAVGNGVVTRSEDIRGYEARRRVRGRTGRAVQDGYRSYGRVIQLKLDSGVEVLMAHLSQRYARAGQHVKGGTVIGLTGNTGHVESSRGDGAHLHFGAKGASPYKFLSTGGYTMSDGPAYLHEDELVISKTRTEALNKSLDSFAKIMSKTKGGKSEAVKAVQPGRGGNVSAGIYNLLNSTSNAQSTADLARLMKSTNVLGLNEFIGHKQGLRKWINERGWGVVGPYGPGGDSALAYNRKKYDLLQSGGQKLNDTESARGGGRSRYASYGLLRDKNNGNEFWNIVAHTVNRKGGGALYQKIQQEQFQALKELADKLSGGRTPVFIMGDLNTTSPNIRGFKGPGRGLMHVLASMGKATSTRTMRGSSDHPALLAQYAFPGLAKGARNINVEGLYKLHRNEGVLTEDINKQFKQGVENFANGGGNVYNIDMLFNGDVNDKAGMRRFILKTIQSVEDRQPTRRKGND